MINAKIETTQGDPIASVFIGNIEAITDEPAAVRRLKDLGFVLRMIDEDPRRRIQLWEKVGK